MGLPNPCTAAPRPKSSNRCGRVGCPSNRLFFPTRPHFRDSPLPKKRAARFVLGSSPDVAVVTAQYSLKKRKNIRPSPDVESAKGRNWTRTLGIRYTPKTTRSRSVRFYPDGVVAPILVIRSSDLLPDR